MMCLSGVLAGMLVRQYLNITDVVCQEEPQCEDHLTECNHPHRLAVAAKTFRTVVAND